MRVRVKSRDITLPTKVRLVKAMVFPVVMYGCESWTVKKAEHQRIDVFELYCWRRLLRIHWTARRSTQSILKEISPECSLEGLMLKLKLQYFGHLMRGADSFEKTLMLGGFGGERPAGNPGADGCAGRECTSSCSSVKAQTQKKLTPWKESYDQSRQHIEKQRLYFANRGLSS